jgi:methionyl-tRNA formyltransferase
MANFVYFGTPDFAVPSLRALHAYCLKFNHQLLHVVCQPDRPAGRGKKMKAPEVKSCALELGLTVHQPTTLKKGTEDGDAYFSLFAKEQVDLAVVVAYGRILPKRLLRHPEHGFVNVHASLLPRWRGAAPIQRAIEAGDAQTGVCIMEIVPQLDAGAVYQSASMSILATHNSANLSEALALLGGDTLTSCLPQLLQAHPSKTAQDEALVTYAKMLHKGEGMLDWHLPALTLWNKARAFTPWPGSFIALGSGIFKFHEPRLIHPIKERHDAQLPVGTILELEELVVVQTGDGPLGFVYGQPPGKKRMNAQELKNGRFLELGQVLISS